MKKFVVSALAVLTLGFSANQAQAQSEPYCREFTQSVNVGNRMESGYGTACLQPDGAWQIVSSNNYMSGQPVMMQQVVERPIIVERPVYRRTTYIPESRIVFNFPLWVGGNGHYHHGYYDRHRERDYRRYERDRDRGHRHHGHRGRGHDRHHHH